MMIVKNAWLILLLLGLVALVYGIVDSRSIDIQMHSTYFVTTRLSLAILWGILLAIQALFYKIIKREKLNFWLTNIHVLGTIVLVLIFIQTLATAGINYIGSSVMLFYWFVALCGVLLVFCVNVIQALFK